MVRTLVAVVRERAARGTLLSAALASSGNMGSDDGDDDGMADSDAGGSGFKGLGFPVKVSLR